MSRTLVWVMILCVPILLGCPAEELLIGKNYMAKAGAFEGLDACLHHHPGPRNIAFNFQMQASADLAIEWRGKSAHSALAPWAGRSALHAMEVFVTAANAMREQMLPTCRLHYYMAEGPKAVNSIPDFVRLIVRFRALAVFRESRFTCVTGRIPFRKHLLQDAEAVILDQDIAARMTAE